MNGYKIMADSYRKLAEQGEITQEQADMECKIFDFLATCNRSDIYKLFDSSAFNDIAESFVRKAVTELTDEGTITEEQAVAVRDRFKSLITDFQAKDVVS